jgi:hypothetical protein
MINSGKTKYSAADSLVGYLYQCRLALLEALKRLKTNAQITVAVETLDDVVFETDGTPTEIIQVKHHINRQANLTDASTDLWKTIRIWCDFYQNGIPQSGTVRRESYTLDCGTARHSIHSERLYSDVHLWQWICAKLRGQCGVKIEPDSSKPLGK